MKYIISALEDIEEIESTDDLSALLYVDEHYCGSTLAADIAEGLVDLNDVTIEEVIDEIQDANDQGLCTVVTVINMTKREVTYEMQFTFS